MRTIVIAITLAAWPSVALAVPMINIGGIQSSCRANSTPNYHTGLPNGFFEWCPAGTSPPSALAYRTGIGEWIEIYGTGMNTLSGLEYVVINFEQFDAGYHVIPVNGWDQSNAILVSLDTDGNFQANVKVPAGLRSGPTFVSFNENGAISNRDVVTIIGPTINGDGIQAGSTNSRTDFLPGTTVAAWGIYAEPDNTGAPPAGVTAQLACPSTTVSNIPLLPGASAHVVQFQLPSSGLNPGDVCAVSLVWPNNQIQTPPVYITINANGGSDPKYLNHTSVYHWQTGGYFSSNAPGSSNLSALSRQLTTDGFHSVRIVMGPGATCTTGTGATSGFYYYNPVQQSECNQTSLRALAQRPDYQALFQSPQFRTILITAYPLSDVANAWISDQVGNSFN